MLRPSDMLRYSTHGGPAVVRFLGDQIFGTGFKIREEKTEEV